MPDRPPVVAPDDDEFGVAPELDNALTDCRSCSTLTAPVAWISCRVSTCTGSAVSASVRLIDDPVISTRCVVSCADAAAPTPAARPAQTIRDARPAHTTRAASAVTRTLAFMACPPVPQRIETI
jgi:hypothetical protein